MNSKLQKLLPKKKLSNKKINTNLNQTYLRITMLLPERKQKTIQFQWQPVLIQTKDMTFKLKVTIFMIVLKLMKMLINIYLILKRNQLFNNNQLLLQCKHLQHQLRLNHQQRKRWKHQNLLQQTQRLILLLTSKNKWKDFHLNQLQLKKSITIKPLRIQRQFKRQSKLQFKLQSKLLFLQLKRIQLLILFPILRSHWKGSIQNQLKLSH